LLKEVFIEGKKVWNSKLKPILFSLPENFTSLLRVNLKSSEFEADKGNTPLN
jgi:hypothetical protein